MADQSLDPGGGQVEKKERKGGGAPRHDKNSGTVKYKDGSYGIDCWINGERVRQKVGTRAQARQLRDDLKAASRRGDLVAAPAGRKGKKRRPLSEWIEEYCRIATSTTQKGEVQAPKWNSTNAGFARNWSNSHGKLFPEQFTLEMLRDWCHDQLRAGKEIASVQRAMDPLRAVYAEIQRAGAISPTENPFRDRKALKLPVRNKKKAPVYLPLAMRGQLAEAFGRWWSYAVFAICTLMRFENQRQLRWDNIDWQGKVANLVMTKNGHSFQVQLSDLAIALLQRQRDEQVAAGKKSEWCWPNSRGGQLDKNTFRNRVWGPAFEKCGLKTMGGGRNGMTWHALGRHTGATWLMQAGEDAFVVRDVMNHESLDTTMIYSHHSDDARRRAMQTLANILTGQSNDPKDRGSSAAVTKEKRRENKKTDEQGKSMVVRFSSN